MFAVECLWLLVKSVKRRMEVSLVRRDFNDMQGPKPCDYLMVYSELCTAMPGMKGCQDWRYFCKAMPDWDICDGKSRTSHLAAPNRSSQRTKNGDVLSCWHLRLYPVPVLGPSNDRDLRGIRLCSFYHGNSWRGFVFISVGLMRRI
jgi:hypothetical protein